MKRKTQAIGEYDISIEAYLDKNYKEVGYRVGISKGAYLKIFERRTREEVESEVGKFLKEKPVR